MRDVYTGWHILCTAVHISVAMKLSVMWFETIGLRTRPVSAVWYQKSVLVLVLVLQVWCCVVKHVRSCHARRHIDPEGQSNFSSTIYSFSVLCLEHHYCVAFTFLKIKSTKCCHVCMFASVGLDLFKELVLFTSLGIIRFVVIFAAFFLNFRTYVSVK